MDNDRRMLLAILISTLTVTTFLTAYFVLTIRQISRFADASRPHISMAEESAMGRTTGLGDFSDDDEDHDFDSPTSIPMVTFHQDDPADEDVEEYTVDSGSGSGSSSENDYIWF